jgi:hypothetical protein
VQPPGPEPPDAPGRSQPPPPPPPAGPPSSLHRALAHIVPTENPTGVIYGIIVIGALLAAESERHETYLDTVASTVIAACLYWLAHAYADVLGRRLTSKQRLTPGNLLQALARNWAIVRGATLPLLALVLAWAAHAPLATGVTIALWSAVASLIVFELFAGIRAHATPLELAQDLTFGATIGVGILLLKVLLH